MASNGFLLTRTPRLAPYVAGVEKTAIGFMRALQSTSRLRPDGG